MNDVYDTYPVVINGSNVVSGTNNSTFTFNFNNTVDLREAEVALQSLSMYYSWINISAQYGNNIFEYTWFQTAGFETFQITLPDGFYQISDINAYLQSVMYSNGHYLINGSNIVYYLEIVTNSSLYAIQVNSYPIPSSLPVGYTAPSNWHGYPATPSTPLFIVEDNAFQQTIGFLASSYPTAPQSTNYSAVSSFTPQVSPVESVLVSCNLLYNTIAIPSNILYSFSSNNATFGSVISVNPNYAFFNRIRSGSYTSLTIQFLDQNFNPIQIKDTSLVLVLSLRIPRRK